MVSLGVEQFAQDLIKVNSLKDQQPWDDNIINKYRIQNKDKFLNLIKDRVDLSSPEQISKYIFRKVEEIGI
ncbi:hypothetical protein IMG5_017620 [Ichthyophthirius multifiliis]|uniref:Uncharacterized protein n=1 Tax=Ichthyophthirius multifiliis TaxID=5932 RepID=G0QKG5_ICHMU|nr:hypothetical protein IMG5_017620 [Ichthyophthirius multifiliis]EGR34287.1 hypothetical protein IMG5_017620 [Ichthyophthirius multifiliis]|eukprot:XP_004039591.1 hypothetical protein IMG5_017620 [Ichthyophthirius multifiliis]